jgi:hypothetical protein
VNRRIEVTEIQREIKRKGADDLREGSGLRNGKKYMEKKALA